MIDFINKFKIPTFLGLGIIFLGIAAGLYLVLREQTFLSQAAPNLTPQNITFTNITEDSVVISWQTNSTTVSFISFGQGSPNEQTVLDGRDNNPAPYGAGPKPRLTHYVTLKNLLPKTDYQFKIISGKITSDILKFTTATPASTQTGFTPIIGSVLDGNTPLNDGVAYLSIPDAVTQSALIKTSGNFLIPISHIRKADLSDVYPLSEGVIAKLTIISDKGDAGILFKLQASSPPLPPISLGQNVDLTTLEQTPQPNPIIKDLDKYDLNSDGKINAADNAIILQNFGPLRQASKNPKEKRADLNEDGVVDQKDLDLMSKQINQ